MESSMPVLAGATSTVMFVLGALPMLYKAYRTKNLVSYSLSNILLINAGNVVHSVYIFHLPPGPIWLLHAFHMLSTGLMLGWYLRYEGLPASLHRASSAGPCQESRSASVFRLRFRRQAWAGEGHTPAIQHAEC